LGTKNWGDRGKRARKLTLLGMEVEKAEEMLAALQLVTDEKARQP